MRKIFITFTFVCSLAWADVFPAENCYTLANGEQCEKDGYICQLGMETAGQSNAIFFFLSSDANCASSNFFKSSKFSTQSQQTTIDGDGNEHPVSTPSQYTKFFVVDDGVYAGPLSVTVAGSIVQSAYNRSAPVHIIYRQRDVNEWRGIRVLSISNLK